MLDIVMTVFFSAAIGYGLRVLQETQRRARRHDQDDFDTWLARRRQREQSRWYIN